MLTNCDAFENFLPPAFRPLQWAAKVPGGLTGMMAGMRFSALRRLPIAYGWLIKRDFADAPTREWVDPYLTNKGIRRDTIKVLKGIDPKYTFEAAEKLRTFDRPAMLAWAVEDRFFKLSFAERLAEAIQGATLERIEDSYTFVSEDQPERLAELIEELCARARGGRVRRRGEPGPRPFWSRSGGRGRAHPLAADELADGRLAAGAPGASAAR